jgi:3D (Asp-Asp-Asp) domain-containing protein
MSMESSQLRAQLHERPSRRSALLRIAGYVGVTALVAISAIVTKEAIARSAQSTQQGLTPLAAVDGTLPITPEPTEPADAPRMISLAADEELAIKPIDPPPQADESSSPTFAPSTDYRYFNGRLIRPVRTIEMRVTAYSPDEKSCGPSAKGITSSIHNVGTNAMRLAAADTRLLPLGSMISVPGYDDGRVIPVLDRGGAIKGLKLDVLFPTDAKARAWGVKKLPVTVWEYADNLPAEDFRAIRDSRK